MNPVLFSLLHGMHSWEQAWRFGCCSFNLRWIKTSGYETSRSTWTGWPRRIAQKSRVLRICVRKFLCNVSDTRAISGLCLLMTSHVGQIRGPRDSQVFTIAHMITDLSLPIHYFLHLRFNCDRNMQNMNHHLHHHHHHHRHRPDTAVLPSIIYGLVTIAF